MSKTKDRGTLESKTRPHVFLFSGQLETQSLKEARAGGRTPPTTTLPLPQLARSTLSEVPPLKRARRVAAPCILGIVVPTARAF